MDFMQLSDFSYECTSYMHPDCEVCDCWCHEDDAGESSFDEELTLIEDDLYEMDMA